MKIIYDCINFVFFDQNEKTYRYEAIEKLSSDDHDIVVEFSGDDFCVVDTDDIV